MVQELGYQCLGHRDLQRFIAFQYLGQVFPAPCRYKRQIILRPLHHIEPLPLHGQIGNDRAVELLLPGIIQPDIQICFYVDLPHPIQRHHIELPYRFVILRRISRGHDDPALRDTVRAEGLVLQKLQHGGRQRLRNAVDLVQEQDALLTAGTLHGLVNGSDDLAHGIFRDRHDLPAVGFFLNMGQADGALAGVVGDGIGHQSHAAAPGDLFHDGRLSDTRRAHQQNGTLVYRRKQIIPGAILAKIRLQGMDDLLFCFLNIHRILLNQ